MPPDNFVWPYYQKKSQKVFLRHNHISGPKYGCFKLSRKINGLVCVPCALFSKDVATNDHGKTTTLEKLVQSPLQCYRSLTGSGSSLDSHLATQYHQNSQCLADNFILSMKTNNTVQTLLDKEQKRQKENECEFLVPILKTIILCGRIGIAYRGHRDDGDIQFDNPASASLGNFKALLSFRVDAGDTILANHLKSAKKNATYISKTSQNELIKLCGEQISESIINEVHKAKYFAVLADETTDSSHREQLCICVRFVKNIEGVHKICEEFLQFNSVVETTGESLSKSILNCLESHRLDISNLVGQGYDGAASMSGYINGVKSKIIDVAPLATYVHCSSHVLNLALNNACSVSEIRNMFGVVKEVTNFINESAKRRAILQEMQTSNSRFLVTLCETRFIERHDALLIFKDQFSNTLQALENISLEGSDRKAIDKARSLIKAMTDSTFIVALCCAQKVMAVSVILSRSLQYANQDLFQAIESIDYVLSTLNSWRKNESNDCQGHNNIVFDEWEKNEYGAFRVAILLAEKSNITLSLPRISSRQTTRCNVEASTISEYYRRAIWYPYLDSIINSLNDKFSSHQLTVLKLSALVPSGIHLHSWKDIEESFYLYNSFLSSKEEVMNEFLQWKSFCMNMDNRPANPLHALDIIPSRFLNIKTLLYIFCTIPVTTCTVERAFSTMKILKNYLRNSMTDDRLAGLALMYIHPDIDIDIKKIIKCFMAAKNKRRCSNFKL